MFRPWERVCVRTCLVCDINWGAGRGAVSSAGHSVDSDRVVSTRLQVVDCGGGLRAGHCELLRITVTSWRKNENVIKVRETNISVLNNQNQYLRPLLLAHRSLHG